MRVLLIAYLLAAAALLCCAQTAQAWWCVGHMTTAQIAKSQMQPTTIAFVEAVIQSLSNTGPFPESPDMAQVACWPDDLKAINLKMMGDWHFIDQPYAPNNFPVPGNPVQNENVAKVIKQFYSGITTNKGNPKGWAMGFAVANLIHFMGDIHQPLHCAELFNAEYPNGDTGGNGEIVFVENTQTNLHAVWDSICWSWQSDLPRPLSSADRDTLDTFANTLLAKYSFTDAQIATSDSSVMALESFNFAVNTSFPGITNNTIISQSYLDACLPVAESRVALGGVRLGSRLEALLGQPALEWAAAKEKEAKDGVPPPHLASDRKKEAEGGFLRRPRSLRDDFESHVLNKTYEALSDMKHRFEHGLRLHAKLGVQHLKKKNI